MQNHTTKHFKDDIQRTLAIYALIPAVIILFVNGKYRFCVLEVQMKG